MRRYDAGIQGEQDAEEALTRQGMTLRTRRSSCGGGPDPGSGGWGW